MNIIKLKGKIRNIQFSHSIKNVDYEKCDLIVPRDNGEEDVLSLVYKKCMSEVYEGQEIEILGNVRSFSQKMDDGKSKVSIYVFTYFDPIEGTEREIVNEVELSGRICKVDQLRQTKNGKHNFHFTLANNIISPDGASKLNNYIPVVCWGKTALDNKDLQINDVITIRGQLHSRMYKKYNEDNDFEWRMAHEIVALEINRDEQ